MGTDREKPAILGAFPLSEAQLAAAMARKCDVAVTAGAGTGKTRTLVARYLSLLDGGMPLRQIVALTFTRKAAREMRNRVRREIDRFLAQENLDSDDIWRWQGYYNELDAARIGTIHNICGDILRAHPAEAAIDPQFVVLDETQSALLAQEAVEMTLAWAVQEEGLDPLFALLRERELRQLLAVFLSSRLAVKEVLQEIAPATILQHWQTQLQANKDLEITKLRSDSNFINAGRILAGNKANNPEDKAEQQRLLVVSALEELRGNEPGAQSRNLEVLYGINLVGGSQKSWPNGNEQLKEVKAALRLLREMVRKRPSLCLSLNAQDAAIAAAMPAIYTAANHVQTSYRALKSEREGLDFDDLEELAIDLLENHPPVRDYWQSQIEALLVDEFQDTNEHQRHFIRLLCPQRDRLFIVGDGKQSIYRFRGADVSVFATEKELIGQQGGRLIDLDVSYRAHEALLEGMNQLLQPVLGDDGPDREPWVAPFAALQAGTKKASRDLPSPYVEFQVTVGIKAKALPRAADVLAERLSTLHSQSGFDYGQMAILCRASNAFQYYEDALDRAGIPYLTVAGKGFYDRLEIRDLLNALQAIADPHDDLALVGLLRSAACGLSDVTLYRLAKAQQADHSLWDSLQNGAALDDGEEWKRLQTAVDLLRDLNQQAGRLPVAAILTQFLEKTFYRAILRRAGEIRALRNVTKLLVDVHDSQLVSVTALLEYVQLLRESGSREGEARAMSGGAVQIMSIHAAKGLEFPVVVLGDAGSAGGGSRGTIVDGDLGILLSGKNDDQIRAASYELGSIKAKAQEAAERARLLYVALTRAEQMLFINGTVLRSKKGELSWSGWLKELAKIIELDGVDLSTYDEFGAGCHLFDFMLNDTAVQAAVYEPNYCSSVVTPLATSFEVGDELEPVKSLQEPLIREEDWKTADDSESQSKLYFEARGEQAEVTNRVVGLLVHEALAMWRFPGPGFDEWVNRRSIGFRLSGERQRHLVLEGTSQMLAHFRQHELYREMAGARRRLHEVPYSMQHNGRVDNGRIDVLFEDERGWTVVDYKTGYAPKEADIKHLRRYGTAVSELMGSSPRLLLCYLNYQGGVRVHEVKLLS